jgi:cytochrome c-type biogenesis protein CcmH/NrfG
MKNRHLAFGVLGIAIGFILGFFTSEFAKQARTGPQPAVAAQQQATDELPHDHPTLEQMKQLVEMQQHAASHPEDKEIRVALGNVYYDMERFDAAIRWYEEAVAIDPSNPNVNTDLGTSYFYTSQPDKAVELYRKSLQIDPKHAQTLENLGVVYFSQGNFEEAARSWEELLRNHPDHPHKEEVIKRLEAAKTHTKTASTSPSEPAKGATTAGKSGATQ